MPNFPFVVSDSLQIGTATISATGNAIVLPAGTTVGATPVATTTEVATGGGPKITNLQITDATWTVLDDTAVDTAGGYVLVTGTNFVTGALVYFNQTPATSVASVSATTLRVTVPALTAGTYIVYVINPDGGTAIRVPGLTASANPAWQTASALPEQYDGVAITLNLVATDATSYTLVSGALPPGLSLNSGTGAITGTVSGVTVDTTYTFTVRATDAQLQDSPRTFTITVSVSDTYFRLTTLLLSGSAISANTVIRDSSINNFNLTVIGDARASNFTPYGTGWSYFFPAGGYVTTGTLGNSLGTGDFCMECWVYSNSYATNYAGHIIITCSAQTIFLQTSGNQLRFLDFNGGSNFIIAGGSVVNGRWYHIVGTRQSGTVRGFIDGQLVVTQASMNFNYGTVTNIQVSGTIESYIVGAKVTIGSVPAAYQTSSTTLSSNIFAVPTGYVSAEANTLLLTAQSNRFLNQIGNVSFATVSGSPRVTSFNPFNITNTGVNGSMYFDGTGDYITVPSDTAWAFGTGDFTMECWIYLNAVSTTHAIMGTMYTTGAMLSFDNTAGGRLYTYVAGSAINANSSSIRVGRWIHVAVTRASGTARIFADGELLNSGSLPGSVAASTFYIGTNAHATSTEFMNGYISNARVIKGTALYTANFTPPTSPLTAIANTQLLTLQYDQPHNNHTFLDSSSNQFLITRNGNATQGTFSPFSSGGYSRYFNGFETYNMGASLAGWGLGIVTLEAWVNVPGQFSLALAYDCVTANSRYVVAISATGKLAVTFTVSTGSQFDLTSVNGITFNTWNHVALEIDARTNTSAVLVAYINGVREVLGTQNMSTQTGLYSNPQIGRRLTGCFTFANENGYVADYRMVKNEFVYTGNFTPPTAPLGTSGALSANSYPTTANVNITWTSANCVALFYGIRSPNTLNAANNSVVLTTSSTTSTVSFSPLIPSSVYNPAVHGGSAYFDGTGDWLSIVDNDQFYYPADFTLEAWCYSTSTTGSQTIVSQIATNNRGINLATGWVTANRLTFSYSTAGNNELLLTDTDNFPVNQWAHVTVSRTGNTISMFVNGIRKATGTVSGTLYNSTRTPTTIGGYSGNSGEDGSSPWNGYISSLRSTKGSSVYDATQSTITIPTAPVTATTNTSLLLNFTDAAILDSTGRTVLETVADAKTSSVITKFTGGSMSFDGAGDYVKITPNYLTGIGTGDFTIEGWWYFLDFTTRTTYFQRFWSFGTGLANDVTLNIDNSGYPVYRNNDSVLITASAALSLSTWTHVALVRYNGTTRIYINGTDRGNTTTNNDLSSRATNIFYIGSESDGAGGYFYGYVSDFRITRYARYTANFTAPTGPVRLK